MQWQVKATLKDLSAMKRKGEMVSEGEMVVPEYLPTVEARKAELLRLQRMLSQKEVVALKTNCGGSATTSPFARPPDPGLITCRVCMDARSRYEHSVECRGRSRQR
jgi:hypothetical protein